ncbi:MAG: tRNA 2-thiouridine(34) synthase MnmA [bacterium]
MKIIVGLSGGVDSSVAALLLKQQGEDVTGMFMKNWEEDDRDGHCTAHEDLADAEAVARVLNIPVVTRNFSGEYWDNVFAYFLDEYRAGRTPNPDILCNREIKFKTFLEHAKDLGADKIATGHYARVDYTDGSYQLLRGKDHNKDQSYFLYTLGQQQLAATLFPIGELEKPLVRQLAENNHLITHNKKDSTGICFIGERDFKVFLSQYIPAQPGKIITEDGVEIGEHSGLMYFTLGQRKGLGIGGTKSGDGTPWFVADKRMQERELVVVQGHNHPALFSTGLKASQLSWVAGQAPAQQWRCTAKTRYRQDDSPCKVTLIGEDQILVDFEQPQWATTPGQSVVFYQDDICLGGGVIDEKYND